MALHLRASLTLTLLANQVASGLALSIFGVGLSAFIGKPYESVTLLAVPALRIPLLADIPVLGPALFDQQALVYAVVGCCSPAIVWFLYRSRAGLVLRAVGESPASAHSIGYPVIRIRYLATIFGGAMAGVGGAFLSVFYTPLWVEGMVAGPRLDRARAGRVRDVAAGARAGRRLPVRRRHDRAALRAGLGRADRDPVAVPVVAAVLGDDRRARRHLAQPQHDPAEFAGVARPAVPAGLREAMPRDAAERERSGGRQSPARGRGRQRSGCTDRSASPARFIDRGDSNVAIAEHGQGRRRVLAGAAAIARRSAAPRSRSRSASST